jgi:hypothetical protein
MTASEAVLTSSQNRDREIAANETSLVANETTIVANETEPVVLIDIPLIILLADLRLFGRKIQQMLVCNRQDLLIESRNGAQVQSGASFRLRPVVEGSRRPHRIAYRREIELFL